MEAVEQAVEAVPWKPSREPWRQSRKPLTVLKGSASPYFFSVVRR